MPRVLPQLVLLARQLPPTQQPPLLQTSPAQHAWFVPPHIVGGVMTPPAPPAPGAPAAPVLSPPAPGPVPVPPVPGPVLSPPVALAVPAVELLVPAVELLLPAVELLVPLELPVVPAVASVPPLPDEPLLLLSLLPPQPTAAMMPTTVARSAP
jgi:hypothetical protein